MSEKKFSALFWMLAFLIGITLGQSCGDLVRDLSEEPDKTSRCGGNQ